MFPAVFKRLLHTSIDSFQGCLKDDTEQGTYDLRWMSAYSLFARLALLFLFTIIVQIAMYNQYASIVLVCLIIIFINVEPYKKSMAYLTRSDAAFLMLLTLVYIGVSSTLTDISHLNNIFGSLLLIVCTTTMFSTLYVISLASQPLLHKEGLAHETSS